MTEWTFVKAENEAGSDGESLKRYQMQALSDIYRTVQPRLDSYRQSAAVIFIGTIAAILAFDSGLSRVIFDPAILKQAGYYPPLVIGVCGALLFVFGFGGWRTIILIGRYYAEMTSIVLKIDKVNRVWDRRLLDSGLWRGDQRRTVS